MSVRGIILCKTLSLLLDVRKITRASGNGRPCLPPLNRGRPRMNRISPFMHSSCHQAVFVRAGMSKTVVALPVSASLRALRIHRGISRPYGGLHQHTPTHGWASPSSARVKCRSHFALASVLATSQVNPNSASTRSNRSCGVSYSTDLAANRASVRSAMRTSNIRLEATATPRLSRGVRNYPTWAHLQRTTAPPANPR